MKKKTINQQIVKALAVGISASMALQPMAVFAEEEIDVPSAPVTPIAEPAPVIADEPVETEVEAAEVTQQAMPTPEVVEAAKEALENAEAAFEEAGRVDSGDIGDAEADSHSVAREILLGSEDVAPAISGEAGVETVPTILGPMVTKDYSGEVREAAVDVAIDQNLEKAERKVEDAKQKIAGAVVSDANENTAVQAAADVANQSKDLANAADKEVEDAITRAGELKDIITNGNKATAMVAYTELEELAQTTAEDLTQAQLDLNDLNDKYMKALGALAKAQDAFDEALNDKHDGALADVGKASIDVKNANADVQELKKAIDAAISKIERTNSKAVAIINAQEAVDKDASTENKDALFAAYVENAYANYMLGDVRSIQSIERDSEHGYMTISYTNSRGKSEKKYFNYTYEDGGITFYEKSDKEIEALNYIDQEGLDEDAEIYYYEKHGKRVYVSAEELGDHLVEIDEHGKETHYIVGEGKTKIKVTPVDAPEGFDDFEEGQDKIEAVSISDEKVSYRLDRKTNSIVKITTGTVTTTEYGKFTYEAAYREEEYTDEEKAAAVEQVGDVIAITEVQDNTTGEIYYVVSGTYIPAIKITLNDLIDYERRTYVGFGRDWEISNAKKAAIDEFLSQLGVGNTTDLQSDKKDIHATLIPSGLGNVAYEDFRITGSVIISKKGEKKFTLTSGEFSTLDAAKKDLLNLAAKKLDRDGIPNNGFITLYAEGLLGSYSVYAGYNEVPAQIGNLQISENEKTLYSFCFDYIQEGLTEIEENKEISKTTYNNIIKAIEIIQNANKDDATDTNDNWILKADLSRVKNLLEKYKKYQEDTIKVQEDIKDAQDDLWKAGEAIRELNNAHKNKKAVDALAELLDGKDIVGYFHLADLSEEEIEEINNLSVGEFIEFLNDMMREAHGKLDFALGKLEILEQLKDEAKEELDNKPEDITGPSGEPDLGPAGPTYDGPDTTITTLPLATTTATPAPAPAAVLGASRAYRRTTTKVAEEETPEVEETKDAPAVQGEKKAPEKKDEKKVETKIADEDTAKAAAPVIEDKPFAWGWLLLILAALAGISVEEYVRRKNAKAKANSVNDTTGNNN